VKSLLNRGVTLVEPVETPPASPSARRYPRLELSAFVELVHSGTVLQLPVRNISRGGVLVGAADHDLLPFSLGSLLTLTLVDADGGVEGAARVQARVVRHDAGGMALTWDDSDSGVATVGTFLDRFYSKR
jgi:hypothetical protein